MNRLMTKREVAEYLRCSKSLVDYYVRKGELPVIQMPGRRLFRECDVLFFVASRSFGHRSTPSIPVGT